MLRVKQANNAFKIRMRELDIELGMAELKNQEQARVTHKNSAMPAIITLTMTAIIAALLGTLTSVSMPEANKEIFYLLVGQASALWGASITYWVGTTRSSSDKNGMLKRK